MINDARKNRRFHIVLPVLLAAAHLAGCRTSGSVLSGNGGRAADYRGVQEEIRSGEAELAVSGANIESASGELARESGELAGGIGALESSLGGGTGSEQEIDAILQRIRGRRVDDAVAAGYSDSGATD